MDAALRAATEQLERAREKEAQQTDRAAAAALLKELDHFRARFLSDPVRGVRIRAASLLAVVPTVRRPRTILSAPRRSSSTRNASMPIGRNHAWRSDS